MPSPETAAEPVSELDVRPLPAPQKNAAVVAAYAALPVGGALLLLDDRDPRPLREIFDREHPGSHEWQHVEGGSQERRIRITKLASTPLPRVLARTDELTAEPETAGPVWKLQVGERDLDSNIIALPPAGTIEAHTGPDLDVLIHVLAGSGQLATELGMVDLVPGALLWLPRRSRREFTAGPDGLRYFTVHQRRQALQLQAPPRHDER